MEDEKTCDVQLFLSNKKDDDNFFIQPPLTGHTKEALALMQQLWSTSSETHNTSEPALPPSDEEPLVSAPKFEIFVDKTEEVPKLPTRIPFLQIFSDDKENAVVKPPKKWKAGDVPDSIFDKENQVLDTENYEGLKSGPDCCKCGIKCKDLCHLKKHILSHYYKNFYDVLPSNKPYECPVCAKTHRDRITLVRHFAFTHNKVFVMTDLTPEMLGSGSKRNLAPEKPTKLHKVIQANDNE